MDFAQIMLEFESIFTVAGGMALLNIILIDIVMSGDNAILIGMATKKLAGKNRKKAIFWGVLGATILRIIFSLGAVWLMNFPIIELFGALLLLYVVWKFYREIRSSENNHHEENGKSGNSLGEAIKTIIIADVAMSLDNVLAVAGASHGKFVYLAIGLIVSIILMVVASGYIAKLLEKYPSIHWAGLFIILFVALEMLEKGVGYTNLGTGFLPESYIFNFVLILVIGLFSVLQAKFLKANHSTFTEWVANNGRILMITIFILLISIAMFGNKVYTFLQSHHGYYYGLIMISCLGILEVLRLKKK